MFNEYQNRNDEKDPSTNFTINEEEVSINLETTFSNLGDIILKTNNEHLNRITCHSNKYKMLTAKSSSCDLVSPSSKSSFFDLLDESYESDKSSKSNIDYNEAFIVDDSLIEEEDDDQSVSVSESKNDSKKSKPIDQTITLDDNNEDEDGVKIEKESEIKKTKGRKHDYEAIDYNEELEKQIDMAW
jgi:hypothetical protein